MTSISNSKMEIWRQIFSRRMLIALFMGFAGGLPLLLTLTLLQAWMKDAGVDLGTIGLFGLVGLPYTLKFLWAPLLDRFRLPFLGRRRGWLIVSQLLIIFAIFNLSLGDPVLSPMGIVIASLLLTFFSATQDIVIDAYRRETLQDDEQGLGAALYVNGYRFATLLVSGGGLMLADIVAFEQVYQLMAMLMLVGVATTLFAQEPEEPSGTPATMMEAVVRPFVDFFRRQDAVLLLAFVVLYKVGDMMADHMAIPFYLDIGFSRTEIGAIAKVFGFGATVAGLLTGGVIILRWGVGWWAKLVGKVGHSWRA
ncbi:MAG: MFS transporter [Pseudomonadota bacterium]